MKKLPAKEELLWFNPYNFQEKDGIYKYTTDCGADFFFGFQKDADLFGHEFEFDLLYHYLIRISPKENGCIYHDSNCYRPISTNNRKKHWTITDAEMVLTFQFDKLSSHKIKNPQ